MKIQTITETLSALPFFDGMSREHLEFIAGCASNVRIPEREFVLRQSYPANRFYLIRSGEISLELQEANRTLQIATVGPGDMIGWSWLIPPYTWHYDGRALTDAALVGFDAECVRRKCDSDPRFGYDMFKRFTGLMADRLMSTRIQLLDVYR